MRKFGYFLIGVVYIFNPLMPEYLFSIYSSYATIDKVIYQILFIKELTSVKN